MESTLAETLFAISQKTHEDCAIKTYHIPYLPRRIYIEAPGIVQIQELMKSSAYGHLVSRATRILDNMNRNFCTVLALPMFPALDHGYESYSLGSTGVTSVFIRKLGEIRYSNMSFMNPSQYYIT